MISTTANSIAGLEDSLSEARAECEALDIMLGALRAVEPSVLPEGTHLLTRLRAAGSVADVVEALTDALVRDIGVVPCDASSRLRALHAALTQDTGNEPEMGGCLVEALLECMAGDDTAHAALLDAAVAEATTAPSDEAPYKRARKDDGASAVPVTPLSVFARVLTARLTMYLTAPPPPPPSVAPETT